MKKRILSYCSRIDQLLEKEDQPDWNAVLEEHLIQISFFQHERLIHLLVTITFAILTILAMGMFLIVPSYAIALLIVLLFVLLIPYIKHYYLLENSVQKMYEQYDQILEMVKKSVN